MRFREIRYFLAELAEPVAPVWRQLRPDFELVENRGVEFENLGGRKPAVRFAYEGGDAAGYYGVRVALK